MSRFWDPHLRSRGRGNNRARFLSVLFGAQREKIQSTPKRARILSAAYKDFRLLGRAARWSFAARGGVASRACLSTLSRFLFRDVLRGTLAGHLKNISWKRMSPGRLGSACNHLPSLSRHGNMSQCNAHWLRRAIGGHVRCQCGH